MNVFSFSFPFGTVPVVFSGVPFSREIAEAAATFASTRVSFQTVIVCQPEMMFWKPCAVASWPLSGIGLRPWAFRSATTEPARPSLAAATPSILLPVLTSIWSKIVAPFWLSQPGTN